MLAASPSQAQPSATTSLLYQTTEETCATAAEFQSQVAGRLGYNPFAEAGGFRKLRVDIESNGQRFVGALRLESTTGELLSTRSITSSTRDCDELVAALSLAVSLMLDPMTHPTERKATSPIARQVEPAPTPRNPAPILPPPTLAPPMPPAPKEHESGRWTVEPSLSSWLAWGAVPIWSTAFSGQLDLRKVHSPWSLGIEGGFILPQSIDAHGGQAQAYLQFGSITPCYRTSQVSMCGIMTAGAFHASGKRISTPATDVSFYAATGLRASYGWKVWDSLTLSPVVRVMVPLRQTTIEVNSLPIWSTPPVWVGAGIAVGSTF